jgi:hypothetical protein
MYFIQLKKYRDLLRIKQKLSLPIMIIDFQSFISLNSLRESNNETKYRHTFKENETLEHKNAVKYNEN